MFLIGALTLFAIPAVWGRGDRILKGSTIVSLAGAAIPSTFLVKKMAFVHEFASSLGHFDPKSHVSAPWH